MWGGLARFSCLELLSRCITRNKVSSHLPTRSTQKCVFTGLASGGINPPEQIYNTLIVPDGGLGGGVYGGRGSAQDSCTTYARMRKYDELSSWRSNAKNATASWVSRNANWGYIGIMEKRMETTI